MNQRQIVFLSKLRKQLRKKKKGRRKKFGDGLMRGNKVIILHPAAITLAYD